MRVYILTDLDGVAGIDQLDPRLAPSPDGPALLESMISLLVGEVTAAIEGAVAAGATEVVVCDGHFKGQNIPPDALPEAARHIGGLSGRGWLPELNSSFDAFLFLGQHAMESAEDAILPHSWSLRRRRRAFLNDIEVGEIGAAVALAASFGVPTVMLSGDRAAVEEVLALVPGVETVTVKDARGPGGTVHLSHVVAREQIRSAVERGLMTLGERAPQPLPPPFTFRFAFQKRILGGLPYLVARGLGRRGTRALFGRLSQWAPGLGVEVRIKDLRTVEFSGDSVAAVLDCGLGFAGDSARRTTALPATSPSPPRHD